MIFLSQNLLEGEPQILMRDGRAIVVRFRVRYGKGSASCLDYADNWEDLEGVALGSVLARCEGSPSGFFDCPAEIVAKAKFS